MKNIKFFFYYCVILSKLVYRSEQVRRGVVFFPILIFIMVSLFPRILENSTVPSELWLGILFIVIGFPQVVKGLCFDVESVFYDLVRSLPCKFTEKVIWSHYLFHFGIHIITVLIYACFVPYSDRLSVLLSGLFLSIINPIVLTLISLCTPIRKDFMENRYNTTGTSPKRTLCLCLYSIVILLVMFLMNRFLDVYVYNIVVVLLCVVSCALSFVSVKRLSVIADESRYRLYSVYKS